MILLQQLAHSILEPAANKVLQYDPNAGVKLAKLEQKSFAIKLKDLSIQVKLWVNQGNINVSSNIENADCLVETDAQHLKTLSDAAQLTKLIKQDQLMLEGDLAVAQSFSNLFLENNIDWLQLLSRYVGDGMAYRIHHGLINIRQLIAAKQVDLQYTANSALIDELKVAPSQYEVEDFVNQVDKISAKVEKLTVELAAIRG